MGAVSSSAKGLAPPLFKLETEVANFVWFALGTGNLGCPGLKGCVVVVVIGGLWMGIWAWVCCWTGGWPPANWSKKFSAASLEISSIFKNYKKLIYNKLYWILQH